MSFFASSQQVTGIRIKSASRLVQIMAEGFLLTREGRPVRMNNSSVSVKALIFQTHIHRLKELMTKLYDESITNAERRELMTLHDDCIEMMANVFENGFLLDEGLLPKEEAKAS